MVHKEPSLFPKMSPKDNEALYIIGNGFDLCHGIKSSYDHFKQYVKQQDNQRLIGMMDVFFSNEHELWADVETALGEYREEDILDYCKPDEEIDYDHMMRSVAAIEDGPDWIFKPILDEFLDKFTDWVNNIDISHAHQKRQLNPQSIYLTFNYTETLEKVYGIPDDNVLHIHGSRKVAGDNYIIGHNNIKPNNLYNTVNGELYFEQDTKNKIVGWMNELYKDTETIIHQNAQFFSSLAPVKYIVVLGHSLNKVDWPYFDEVKKCVAPNSRWIFVYNSDKDKENMEAYVAHSGIANYNILNCTFYETKFTIPFKLV